MPPSDRNSTGNPVGVNVIPSSVARFAAAVPASPGSATPDRSPLTSDTNTGTPAAESCSAMPCSVFVLPVPVAPAIRPWRLTIRSGSLTTASGTTAPSSTPRPRSSAAPSAAYAVEIVSAKSAIRVPSTGFIQMRGANHMPPVRTGEPRPGHTPTSRAAAARGYSCRPDRPSWPGYGSGLTPAPSNSACIPSRGWLTSRTRSSGSGFCSCADMSAHRIPGEHEPPDAPVRRRRARGRAARRQPSRPREVAVADDQT